MPLTPDTTLSSYEVTVKIGEGGIVNVAANVRFPESRRSECTYWD